MESDIWVYHKCHVPDTVFFCIFSAIKRKKIENQTYTIISPLLSFSPSSTHTYVGT